MVQTTATKPATKPTADKTCATCPNFNKFDFHHELDKRDRGSCLHLDQIVYAHHPKTNDCVLNLATEIIWVDRDGYPMGEQTVENAYFSTNIVFSPNEPF